MPDSTTQRLANIERALLGDTPLPDCLRMCVALGSNIRSARLREWAQHELNGYRAGHALPAYRTVGAALLGDIHRGPAHGQHEQIALNLLPEDVRKILTDMDGRTEVRDSVAEIAAIVARAHQHSRGLIILTVPDESRLRAAIAENAGRPVYSRIYWSIAAAAYEGLLDRVRTAAVLIVMEVSAEAHQPQEPDSADPLTAAADQAVALHVNGSNNQIHINQAGLADVGASPDPLNNEYAAATQAGQTAGWHRSPRMGRMPSVDLRPEQLKLLERIGQNSRGPVDFGSVVRGSGLAAEAGNQAGDALQDLGLIEDFGPRTANGKRTVIQVTGAGRQLLAQVSQEREDRGFRRASCQRQLLVYADQDPTPSPWPQLHTFIDAPDVRVHGARFTLSEAHRAATNLAGERLLEYRPTAGEDGTFKITHLGSRCVEDFDGDMNAWRKQQMRPSGHHTVINQGPGSSANTIVGDGNVASQSATSTANIEEAAKWVENLLGILPLLQIPGDQATEIQEAAEQVQAETEQPSPSPSRLRAFGRTALDLLIRGLQDAALAQAPLVAQAIIEQGEGLFSG